jgi:hypothetical protein
VKFLRQLVGPGRLDDLHCVEQVGQQPIAVARPADQLRYVHAVEADQQPEVVTAGDLEAAPVSPLPVERVRQRGGFDHQDGGTQERRSRYCLRYLISAPAEADIGSMAGVSAVAAPLT